MRDWGGSSPASWLDSIHTRSLFRSSKRNRAVAHSVGQVLANAGGKGIPTLGLQHQAPKTMRPI